MIFVKVFIIGGLLCVLAQGAIEEVQKKVLLGAFSGGITAAAAGITAAIVFGYLVALAFRPKA